MSFLNKMKGWGQDRSDANGDQPQGNPFDDGVQRDGTMTLPNPAGMASLDVPAVHVAVPAGDSIITEAAPSEMADFAETRLPDAEAASADAGSGLPFIGKLPMGQQ
jgi:twitching motility protein PilJ